MDIEGEEIVYYLKKIDGKWKIDIYKSAYEAKNKIEKKIKTTNKTKSNKNDDNYDY